MTEVSQPELDAFVKSYIETAMTDTADDDNDALVCEHISDLAREHATKDCKKFLEENYETLSKGDEGVEISATSL